MNTSGKSLFPLLVGAIVALGALPVFLYWVLFARVPGVTVDEARVLLSQTNAAVVLVDVRSPNEFAANHLSNAVNWPGEAIAALKDTNTLPAGLSGKTLLLICDGGLRGARAADHLAALGLKDARNIPGGMAGWNTLQDGKCCLFNLRPSSRLDQWLVVITSYGIKPLYVLMATIWILWLWRQSAPDLAALKWGLVLFWLGENACSINYLAFDGQSDFWEFAHNYGMASGFSLIAYAALEGVDNRLVKFSPPGERCAVLSLCKTCIKYTDVPCALQRLFKMIIPALMILSFIPLLAEIKVISYNTLILGYATNWSNMVSSQLFETRYCPALAFLLFTTSWAVMWLKKDNPVPMAKILFAAGMGPFGFGMMRLFLYSAYSENLLWFVIWEEWTEMVFVASVGYVLWVFRHSLFSRKLPAVTHQATA